MNQLFKLAVIDAANEYFVANELCEVIKCIMKGDLFSTCISIVKIILQMKIKA